MCVSLVKVSCEGFPRPQEGKILTLGSRSRVLGVRELPDPANMFPKPIYPWQMLKGTVESACPKWRMLKPPLISWLKRYLPTSLDWSRKTLYRHAWIAGEVYGKLVVERTVIGGGYLCRNIGLSKSTISPGLPIVLRFQIFTMWSFHGPALTQRPHFLTPRHSSHHDHWMNGTCRWLPPSFFYRGTANGHGSPPTIGRFALWI